jgi:hypothetical protein
MTQSTPAASRPARDTQHNTIRSDKAAEDQPHAPRAAHALPQRSLSSIARVTAHDRVGDEGVAGVPVAGRALRSGRDRRAPESEMGPTAGESENASGSCSRDEAKHVAVSAGPSLIETRRRSGSVCVRRRCRLAQRSALGCTEVAGTSSFPRLARPDAAPRLHARGSAKAGPARAESKDGPHGGGPSKNCDPFA